MSILSGVLTSDLDVNFFLFIQQKQSSFYRQNLPWHISAKRQLLLSRDRAEHMTGTLGHTCVWGFLMGISFPKPLTVEVKASHMLLRGLQLNPETIC